MRMRLSHVGFRFMRIQSDPLKSLLIVYILNSSYMFIKCLLLGIGISCCWPQGRADVVVTEVYELVEYYELVVRGSCRTGVRSDVLCDRHLLGN